MTTNFDYINFASTLSAPFKDHMKKKMGLNPNTICYKPDENGELSAEARIVMACWITYEECNTKILPLEMRALAAEAALQKPNCYWNEKDEDGPTFSTLDELIEYYKPTAVGRYGICEIGRSVQIDNTYAVVDYKNNKVSIFESSESAMRDYVRSVKQEQVLTAGVFQLPTPKPSRKKK